MQAIALPDDQKAWRSPLFSIALHLMVIALLAFIAPIGQRPAETEIPVSVEILAPRQRDMPEEATKPPATPQPRSLAVPAPPVESAERSDTSRTPPRLSAAGTVAPPLVRPEKMLSQGALANPRSSAARRELRLLAADERAVQLCNIEAMEQVHAWKARLFPEAVVAYATKGLKIRGGSIVADGAAFYSASSWHRLRFECDVRDDEVVSFAYSVGDLIPRSEWEAYSLPEKADDDD